MNSIFSSTPSSFSGPSLFGAQPSSPPIYAGLWYHSPTFNPYSRNEQQQRADKSLLPVPLKGVEVKGHVVDLVAEVEIIHHYENKENDPIEAIYNFPVEDKAAVCAFEAFIDGKKVVGEIQDKEEALNTYDDAISSGHGAYLLEQKSDKVFSANIGNLPPGKAVKVVIRYVTELSMEEDYLRFVLPTTIAPSYDAQQYSTPPSRDPFGYVPPPQQNKLSYDLSFTLDFEMFCKIKSIGSVSHNMEISIESENKAQVTLALGKTTMDKDVVVRVQLTHPNHPRCWIEQDPEGTKTAMLAFYPKIECPDPKSEIIFIVDRSGSMMGPKIESAKQTLHLFLRSLPESCIFQIIGFGSGFKKLFPMSAPYNDDTLKRATEHVDCILADLGGTELLTPLGAVLKEEASKGYPRQIFILTDGEVDNTDQVVSYVRKHANTTRVFTFGIGADVSQALCRELAEAGNGAAEFVAEGGGQDLQLKVCKQLKRALQPAITNLHLDWGDLSIKQAPAVLPPLFNGGRMLVYGFIGSLQKSQNVFRVHLQGDGPYGSVSFPLDIDITCSRQGFLLSKLAGKSLIRDLEAEDNITSTIKEQIIKLSKKYTLASKFTSFVAVEERNEATLGTMQTRKVPSAHSKPKPQGFSGNPYSNSASLFSLSAQTGGGGTFGGYGGSSAPSFNFASAAPVGVFGSAQPSQPATGASFGFGATPSGGLPQYSAAWGASTPFGGASSSPFGGASSNPFGATSSSSPFGGFSSSPAPVTGGLMSNLFAPTPTAPPLQSTAPMQQQAPSFSAPAQYPPSSVWGSAVDFCDTLPTAPAPHSSSRPTADPFSSHSLFDLAGPPQQHQQQHLQQQQTQQQSMWGGQVQQKPSAPAPDMSALNALIQLQKANGSWELNAALARAVGIALNQLSDMLKKMNGVPEDVWASAVAVAFLDARFSGVSDMWSLIADKAQKYAAKVNISAEAWGQLRSHAKALF